MKRALLLSVAILILLSCQPPFTPEAPSATPGFSTVVPEKSVPPEVKVGFRKGFDPAWLWLPHVPEPFSPLDLAFESLLSLSSSRTIAPGLANFEISPDATVITFTLRPGIFWHSGEMLTASYAANFLELAFSPERRGPLSSRASLLKRVKVHDERTFTVFLAQPDCSLITEMGLLKLTRPPSFPQPPSPEKLAGTGPFRVIRWSEDEISLEEVSTSPKLSLHFYRFSSGEELLRAYRAGEITTLILSAEDATLAKGLDFVRFPSPELYFIAFNLREPVLADSKVRKALTMAIPREKLLEQAFGGEGVPARGPFLPGYLVREPELPPFNPAEALRLLGESGWIDENGDGFLEKDGKPLKLKVLTNGENKVRESLALEVTRYYRAIGIDAELNVMEWGNFLKDLFGGYFQVAVFSVPLGPDPDLTPFFSAQGVFNFSGLNDPEVEKLLKEGLQVKGCAPDIRKEVYSRLAYRLAELRPWDCLFFPYTLLGPGAKPLSAP